MPAIAPHVLKENIKQDQEHPRAICVCLVNIKQDWLQGGANYAEQEPINLDLDVWTATIAFQEHTNQARE